MQHAQQIWNFIQDMQCTANSNTSKLQIVDVAANQILWIAANGKSEVQTSDEDGSMEKDLISESHIAWLHVFWQGKG